ncbi:MAG: ROK family protein [Verrucomicrobiota bacterium]
MTKKPKTKKLPVTRKEPAKPVAIRPVKDVKLKVLVIDIGGTHVKMSCKGHSEIRKFPSGPRMTPSFMIKEIKRLTSDWNYDVISMGCPMPVRNGKPIKEPVNLGNGWVGLDYEKAFGSPIKIINDATMQALGDYEGGRILFLGFGTGLGSTLIEEGVIVPLELAELPYKKGNFEKYTGNKALEKKGKKKWTKEVCKIIELLRAALEPEEIVLGGGNAINLKKIPKGCRVAENSNAFIGGFRLWEHPPGKPTAVAKKVKSKE